MLKLRKDSQEWINHHLASQLLKHPIWLQFLKPELEKAANRKTSYFPSNRDEELTLLQTIAEADYARRFIRRIENLAEDFETNVIAVD